MNLWLEEEMLRGQFSQVAPDLRVLGNVREGLLAIDYLAAARCDQSECSSTS
ncbi:MAG: hypothetical protein AAGA40_07100 [Cyanobacteria bacterium P01_E01_bin.45]